MGAPMYNALDLDLEMLSADERYDALMWVQDKEEYKETRAEVRDLKKARPVN